MYRKTDVFLLTAHVSLCRRCSYGIAQHGAVLLLLSFFLFLSACSGISPVPTRTSASPEKELRAELPKKIQDFATPDKIEALTPRGYYQYRLGPGDLVSIQVWRRPELSQEGIIVSPDGFIAVPRIGSMSVLNRTQEEVRGMITRKLEVLYVKPEVTVRIQEFHNNKAFVLGRVSKPGVVNFPGKGTLLEALALAGGIPDQSKETSLTKCAIIRGNDTVIWIDLQDLLKNGNMALNSPIRNNDVIYIPEASDELVYVLGEVVTPGAFQLKNGMTVLKAVMVAGGMSKHANPEKVFVIRQQNVKGDVIMVDLKNLLQHGDFSQNFSLMANDIVYISPTGIAKFNYALEKILPSLQMLNLGTTNLESFGVMQELRKQMWGQEGFVNSSGD
ncbi:SLBB domain-containing protein [Chlorobium phaeobacteroides]|uniref:Polysaccharide export protein n=1 Tax=Chlorobium phaeobacteroides (strain DSM 266 / SMG 266 / 2430) TaxID=290317 RepID=A1BHG2_CHLPD|nr:SLBB domain-containing protein [Chlorobium phaeobacteroides]ABL65839.1 polysaccharide export protein [Chlorobium phaeobacteroides DSM 266]